MKLNDYMTKKISDCDKEDLCEDLLQDAQSASEFGVGSDKEYNLYFFINHLIEELLVDTFDLKLDKEELGDLKRFVFSFKDNTKYDLTNLVDLRIIVYKWLSEKKTYKKAHPNISGIYVGPSELDTEKWTEIAKQMYNQIHAFGITREAALQIYTKGWDKDEIFKFDNWLRYYEQKTPEKYKVKIANIIKTAFNPSNIVFPKEWEKPENRTQQPFSANDGKTKKELEIDRAKSFKTKMKSRIRALKSLLDKYNDLLPHQNLDGIHDEMVALEKSIGKLNVFAAIQDRIIRSAAKMEKFGFSEGSSFLKEAADISPQSLQSGPSDETNLPPGALKVNVDAVIGKLEGISKVLKMRELVRELSKTDIMLSELGMASYFPEVTDALSKLIEGFSYSSNRIESVIAKLRGSGKTQMPQPKMPEMKPKKTEPAPLPMPPIPATTPEVPKEKLEPSSLHEAPVSKVQTKLPEK